MKLWKLLPVAIIISLFSCKEKDDKIDTILKNATEVSCKILPTDFMLGTPYQIKLINNTLIVADHLDDNSIFLYDYANNKLLGRMLRRGQGPNEVMAPLLLGVSRGENLISVFQRQTGKYTEHRPDELLNNNPVPAKTLQFEHTDRLIKGGNGYISEGEYSEGSINLLDINGNHINTENVYPQYINELEDNSSKYIYGQGVISYNEKENIFIFASFYTGEVLFYKVIGSQFEWIKSHDYSINSTLKNRIRNDSQHAHIQQTDIEYFSDICSSTESIYILYSGVSMKDKRSVGYSHILKFSPQGEFLNCYKTDMKITCFCVDNEDRKIYAIGLSEDFEYHIVQIEIV